MARLLPAVRGLCCALCHVVPEQHTGDGCAMRQIFFRPIAPKLQELWGRCSNCYWSGALLGLTRWSNADMQLDLWTCDACAREQELCDSLSRNGWSLWDK